MKKIKSLLLVLSVAAIYAFCVTASACAVYLDVFEENYTEWYTDDGICGFTSTLSDTSAYGYVTINGIKARAIFGVTPTAKLSVNVMYSEELNLPKDENYREDEEYGATYFGRISDSVHKGDIFSVKSFELGSLQLGPFEMHSRKVDPSTVDARDYTDCEWTSADGNFKIDTWWEIEMDVYRSNMLSDGKEVPVHFKWCDNKRFEIYNGEENATERNVLASGTYANIATQLSLTFEEDSSFGLQGQTINLTCKAH